MGIYYKQKQLSWSGFKFSHKIATTTYFLVYPYSVPNGNRDPTVETQLHGIPTAGRVPSVYKSLLLCTLPLIATALKTAIIGVFDISTVKPVVC